MYSNFRDLDTTVYSQKGIVIYFQCKEGQIKKKVKKKTELKIVQGMLLVSEDQEDLPKAQYDSMQSVSVAAELSWCKTT